MNDVCYSTLLKIVVGPLKDLVSLFQIIGPILCVISLGYTFVKLMQHPDDKKIFARIKNSLLAVAILFFIPTLVIAVLNMVDETSEFGACWKNGGTDNKGTPGYIEVDKDNDRTNIIGDSNYEKGVATSSSNGGSSSSSSSSTGTSNTSSNTGSAGSSSSTSGSSTVSTGTGVIGMHINSINKIVYNLYDQSSSEWKGHTYSSGQTIAQNGCMNTSVAVVSSSYDKSITPVTVFNKYRHSHPSSAVPGLTKNAFSCSFGNANKNDIVNALKSGNVVIIKVYGKNKGGSSSFTSSQHYMALIDINSTSIFVGNAYSNSTYGKAGWFSIDTVLTSVQTAEYCYPSSSLKG